MLKYLIFFFVFYCFAVNANDCSHLKSDCEYYLCLEKNKQCGSYGYPQNFGFKYCSIYEKYVFPRMTDLGQQWLSDVKRCLIRKIDEFPQEQTCGQLKHNAIQSHYECYYEANFCKLNKREKFLVIKTVKRELKSFRMLRLGMRILRSCRWF